MKLVQGIPRSEKLYNHHDGEIGDDVNRRIKLGWVKWKRVFGVLCDLQIPVKLKRTNIRPTLLYVTECWSTKKEYANKMSVAEMRMLKWT